MSGLLAAAEETDKTEDAKYEKNRRADELPEELARRESQLVTMPAAKRAAEQARVKDRGQGEG